VMLLMSRDVLIADIVDVQEDDEQLMWQEKPASSLTTHTAPSSDTAAKRIIGPRIEVYSMLHLYLKCR